MDLQEAVDTYGEAWNESDGQRRLELLERAWAEGGTYTDPTSEVEGRAALAEHIEGFRQQFAGHRIENASAADGHHGWFRFAWRMVGPDGTVGMEGFDVGQVDDDGRISSIVGFFGPFPDA